MLNQSSTTPEQLYAFQTISDFVTNLHDFYIVPKGSKKNTSTCGLDLYYRLLSKVGFVDKLIVKHLEVFKKFCLQNRRCINKQELPLNHGLISFSDKIFIDMDYIFRVATVDENTKTVIWQYLLQLSALLDPKGGAKNVLSTLTVVEEDESPDLTAAASGLGGGGLGAMMASMMSGGSDQGMDTFDMPDMSGLSGMLQTMMGAMGNTAGTAQSCSDQSTTPMLGMLQNMLNPSGEGGSPLDMIQNMMNPDMISTLMGSLSTTLKEQNIDMPKIFNSMHDVINKLERDIVATDSTGHGQSDQVVEENTADSS
jgi:hypothetical protein